MSTVISCTQTEDDQSKEYRTVADVQNLPFIQTRSSRRQALKIAFSERNILNRRVIVSSVVNTSKTTGRLQM